MTSEINASGPLHAAARSGLARWHAMIADLELRGLPDLLCEHVRFRSPFVWKPYEGKDAVQMILGTVVTVFEDFKYVREFHNRTGCVLEFTARVGDRSLHGVDLIEFDDAGKIVDFEVMIRPANALQALGAEMGKRLAAGAKS